MKSLEVKCCELSALSASLKAELAEARMKSAALELNVQQLEKFLTLAIVRNAKDNILLKNVVELPKNELSVLSDSKDEFIACDESSTIRAGDFVALKAGVSVQRPEVED